MKPVGLISMGVLLLLGTVGPTCAQQEQQPEDKTRKQEQKPKPEKQQEAKPQKQEERQANGQQEQEKKQDSKPHKQEEQQEKSQLKQQQANRPSQQVQYGQRGEQQAVWQEHRAHDWKSEHRDWQQRGGYNGYRIPEDLYRSYFGPSHAFRINSYPVVVVGGYPRFQYGGGFWLSVVDPWPEYWSDDWYNNDDVYIEYYGGGYYLYNRRYPQDRIAVIVSVN